MTVETATKISQLLATAPPGTDPKSEGDNHLRLIKGCLQSVFDDSGTTLKTTLPIESPAGAVIPSITGDLTISGKAKASGGYINPLFLDVTDNTKMANLDLTGITPGQNRAIKVPDKPGLAVSCWELIMANANLAGLTTLEIPNLAAFAILRVTATVWFATVPANNMAYRVSTDNGATWKQGATDYEYESLVGAGGTPGVATARESSARIFAGPLARGSWTTTIYNFNNVNFSTYLVTQGLCEGASTKSITLNGVERLVLEADNALQVMFSTGPVQKGNIILEGVRG